MIVSSQAKRYAKALFELASEQNQMDEINQDFNNFFDLIKQNPDLKAVLQLPPDNNRQRLIAELMQDRFSGLFFNFLLLVLKNKRFKLIDQIYHEFVNRLDAYYNRVPVETITAIPLGDDHLLKLRQQIGRYLNAEVRLESKVDPSIVGGIIIRQNGRVFNASLAEQFKRLKQYLIKNQK